MPFGSFYGGMVYVPRVVDGFTVVIVHSRFAFTARSAILVTVNPSAGLDSLWLASTKSGSTATAADWLC